MYFRRSYVIRLTRRVTNFGQTVLTQIQIGSSAFVTELAMSVMMFTGNYVFLDSFGENGVAAFSIACYLFPLIFMINNAVAQSAQPIISFNFGAGNSERVSRAFKVSLAVGLTCGAIAALSIALGARGIVSLFIPADSQAGEIAVNGLPIFATAAIFFALNIACIGYYQSVKKAVLALVLTLLRGVVFLVPLFFVLSAIFPTRGMWAAIPVSEALTLAVIGLIFLRSRR